MFDINRRKTLKTLACCSTAIASPNLAFGSIRAKDIERWDEKFDAIVVGSGFAGSAAMLSLLDNGITNCIMIEKCSIWAETLHIAEDRWPLPEPLSKKERT